MNAVGVACIIVTNADMFIGNTFTVLPVLGHFLEYARR